MVRYKHLLPLPDDCCDFMIFEQLLMTFMLCLLERMSSYWRLVQNNGTTEWNDLN